MKKVDESAKRVDSFFRSAIGRIVGRDDTLSDTPAHLQNADTCSGRPVSGVYAFKRFPVSVMTLLSLRFTTAAGDFSRF